MKIPNQKAIISRRQALGVIAAGALAAGSLFLPGCSNRSQHGGILTEYYESPYDFRGLVRDGQILRYYEEGVLKSRFGIDVSEHQHQIDWSAVATAGVEFAFIRIGNRGATAGALNTDDYFLANALGAQNAGIPASAYFFSQAITEAEAEEEAAFALQQLRSAEMQGAKFSALAYDHERVNVEGARANDIEHDQLSANALTFCSIIANAGYEPLIYGNQRDLRRLDVEALTTYPVWYAEYDVEAPTAPLDFQIWQYSNAGQIPGITTNVDLNIWFDISEDSEDTEGADNS